MYLGKSFWIYWGKVNTSVLLSSLNLNNKTTQSNSEMSLGARATSDYWGELRQGKKWKILER